MSKTPTNTTLDPLYHTVVQQYNIPYGSSYVHGKMSTNDLIKKIEC